MSIIDDLNKIKSQLKAFKEALKDTSNNIDLKEVKYQRSLNNVNSINKPKNELVTFNVGNKIFTFSKSLFTSVKDTLLDYIINSGEFDLNEEIFIDRDPKYFPMILDYLRGYPIDYSKFRSKQEFNLFRREIEFYQLTEIIEYIESRFKEIKYKEFSMSNIFMVDGDIVGTNVIEDIYHPDGVTGICCKAPGCIIIELNDDWDFDKLEIGGYRGNKKNWAPENGASAEILISSDKVSWTKVGIIPVGFGVDNKEVHTGIVKARYIKFKSSSYIGIGYLKVFKTPLIEEKPEEDLISI